MWGAPTCWRLAAEGLQGFIPRMFPARVTLKKVVVSRMCLGKKPGEEWCTCLIQHYAFTMFFKQVVSSPPSAEFPYLTFVEVSVVCSCSAGHSGPSFQNTKQGIPLWRWPVNIVKQSDSQHFFQRIVAWEVTCSPKDYVSLGSILELSGITKYKYIYIYTRLLATFEHLTVTIAPEL